MFSLLLVMTSWITADQVEADEGKAMGLLPSILLDR